MYIVAVLHTMSHLQEIHAPRGRLWTMAHKNPLWHRVVHMNPIKHVEKCFKTLPFLYLQMIFLSFLLRLLSSLVTNKNVFHTKVLT